MKHIAIIVLLSAIARVAAASSVCVPEATGVPTREGPPKWINWADAGPIAVDVNLDDPRWVSSTGHTFERGSAKAPLQTRALWKNQAGKEYLYLSFIVDLDAFDVRAGHESVARRRDIFLGFRRPDTSGAEKAYLLQFHLTGPGVSGVSTPTPCDSTAACNEDNIVDHALWRDYWRVFVDRGNTGVEGCSGTTETGHKYEALPSASVPWLTGPTLDSVRYWKVSSSDPSPLLRNRWAVQVRIPMVAPVAAGSSTIATGIERGSTFFYEATAELDRPAAPAPPPPLIDIGPFARVGWYPATLTNTVCPTVDTVIHPEPAVLAGLSTSGPRPADCEGGISIDRDHIGVLFNQPVPADPEVAPLDWQFKAYDASHTPRPNTVIALPENQSSAPITAPLLARFRLAGWGSAPWSSTTDTGTWKDIRGAKDGICAAGAPGACTPVTIAAHKHVPIAFSWQLGGDTAGIGDSEYCEFGLLPPTGSCVPGCACADCGAGGGTQAVTPTKTWPCVPSIYKNDQCMLVELDAPNGNATFVHQSIWRNMAFGAMSIHTRDALIDARQLPTEPGQRFQDIYFVAIPRNMPGSVPSGTTTVLLTQKAALASAFQIARPYIEDLQRDQDRQKRIRALFARSAKGPKLVGGNAFGGDGYGGGLGHGTPDDRLAQQIVEARVIMPPGDFDRVGNLLALAANQGTGNAPHASLVQDVVKSVGSSAAAEVAPTLEFYPFYRRFGKGAVYDPMTSFAVFLSHEQTLSGMDFQIDGADRVGENVYRMQIPVGFARKIQIRAQASVGPGAALPPGNASWPCAGGCACGGGAQRRCGLVSMVGNTTPGLIAGVLVIRRRKKKPAKPAGE